METNTNYAHATNKVIEKFSTSSILLTEDGIFDPTLDVKAPPRPPESQSKVALALVMQN